MQFKSLKLIGCLGSLAILCLHSNQAEAIFASVKSTGMAATAVSYPLDTLCGAYNPAGESFIGDRADAEVAWVRDWGHTTIKGNNAPNPITGQPLPTNGKFNGMVTRDAYPVSFGLNKTWCLNCDWELATSVIFYNRNFQKTTYSTPQFLLGTSNAGLEYFNQTLAPIVSLKWCDKHSIPIAVNYQVERIKANGLQNFDHAPTPTNPTGTVAPGHVTNRGYDWSTGWGVTIGYLGRLTDCLSIGFAYTPKTRMTRMSKYEGFLAQHGRLDIPQRINAGISYKFLSCVVLAFDIEHVQWSQIKALANPLISSHAAIPGIPNLLGSSDGPGFGFRNQWFYRVGLEWTINPCWVARLGYRYGNTPIKNTQTAVNSLTLDTVESFVTAGGTWNITENNELSVVYAYGFQNTIKGKNSIPALFYGGESNLTETKYALGVAWGWKF